jgi:hypothetical protein
MENQTLDPSRLQFEIENPYQPHGKAVKTYYTTLWFVRDFTVWPQHLTYNFRGELHLEKVRNWVTRQVKYCDLQDSILSYKKQRPVLADGYNFGMPEVLVNLKQKNQK